MNSRHTVIFVVLPNCRTSGLDFLFFGSCLNFSFQLGCQAHDGSRLDCSSRGDAEVEAYQLFENQVPDEHGKCPKSKSLSASHTAKIVSPQNLVLPTFPKQLPSKGGFWSPLKAIPLSSFYKLHRMPSVTAMTEPGQDDALTIELPRSEPMSSPEPHHALPQNGVIHNKLLEQVIRTPGRLPSPQPTHLGVPGPSQHRVLHEEGSGYVAPKFEGKELQMDQGMCKMYLVASFNPELTWECSHGSDRGKRIHTA